MSEQAKAAKLIRAELKLAFSGIEFSVRSKSYAGGDSVNIYWTNGPTTFEVREISNKYQYGHFNGMEDIYNYRADNGLPTVSSIFVNNDHSDELKQSAWDHLRSIMAGFEDAPTDAKDAWNFYSERGDGGSEWLNRVLSGRDFPEFNRARKQRIAA